MLEVDVRFPTSQAWSKGMPFYKSHFDSAWQHKERPIDLQKKACPHSQAENCLWVFCIKDALCNWKKRWEWLENSKCLLSCCISYFVQHIITGRTWHLSLKEKVELLNGFWIFNHQGFCFWMKSLVKILFVYIECYPIKPISQLSEFMPAHIFPLLSMMQYKEFPYCSNRVNSNYEKIF